LVSARTLFADKRNNKADVVEHPEVFDHVGILVNRPPGTAGLPFSSSSDDSELTALASKK
jgi:hypothetical protein